MGFFQNLLENTADSAVPGGGFFAHLLMNQKFPTAPGITGPANQPNTPVTIGQVAAQIPAAASNVLGITPAFQAGENQAKKDIAAGKPNTIGNDISGIGQAAGGFFGQLAKGVAQTAVALPAGAVASVTGEPFLGAKPFGEQFKSQGILPSIGQNAASLGILADGVSKGVGFFDGLKGEAAAPISDTTLELGKTNPVAVAQDYREGQTVRNTSSLPDTQAIDAHAAVIGKATNAPAMATFIPGDGPDIQHVFNGLQNPEGLQKTLAVQGVPSTVMDNGALIVHDTDGLSKGLINQVAKENYLNPPTQIKGNYNIMEGDQYDGHIKAVQSNPQGAATPLPDQGAENSGSLQNPAVSEEPNNPSGASNQQVLSIDENAKRAVLDMGKALPQDIRNSTVDWINQRETAGLEAQVTARPFQALDAEGVNAFKEIQSGNTEGLFGQVRQYFDSRYQQLTNAGIGKYAGFEYKNNYLPQVWQNTPEEISNVFSKTVKESPQFTFESVIKDYETGIKAGLTPKYTTVSQLVQWYEQSASKALADHSYFESMVDRGVMERGPISGWKNIEGTDYYAPRPLAETINNYLQPGGRFLEATSRGVGALKAQVMTQGIPGTAISPHGITTLARDVLSTPVSQGGFIGGLLRAIPEALYTPLAKSRFLSSLPDSLDLYKAGLTPTGEDINLRSATDADPQGIVGKLLDINRKAFHDPVFQNQLPEAKQNAALSWSQKMQDAGVPKDQADAAASKFANTFFGGNNYDALLRNKDAQNFFRTTLFAPDMIESLAKTFGETGKSLTTKLLDPTYAPYRAVAMNMAVGVGIVGNLLNKALSGHFMFQNEGSFANKFKLDTGTADNGVIQGIVRALGLPITYSGGQRYLNFLGSAGDFVKLPAEAANDLRTGNVGDIGQILRNRLSGPAQGIVSLASNTNSLGNPLSGPGISGPQTAANAVNAVLGAATPPVVQQAANAGEKALGLNPTGQSASSLAVTNFLNNQQSGGSPNPYTVTAANTGSSAGTFGKSGSQSVQSKARNARFQAQRAGSRAARSAARRGRASAKRAGRVSIKTGGRRRA